MIWLYAGVAYASAHLLLSWALRDTPTALLVFGNLAQLVAALVVPVEVFRRRRSWGGCQWIFWTTIALGACCWALGQIGWMMSEVFLHRPLPWLGWQIALNMTGSIAPLLALRARPHRGPRRAAGAAVAVDIAGLAVIAAFLYLYFVFGPTLAPGADQPAGVLRWAQFQRLLLLAGMAAMAIRARETAWAATFQKLTLAAAVGVAGRTLLNRAVARGAYYTGSPFDLAWIVPFFLYAWAARTAPSSGPASVDPEAQRSSSSAPWLIFAIVVTLPIVDFSVRHFSALGPRVDGFRDTVATSAIVALLALLTTRIGIERAARRRTDARLRLMAAAVQQTDDLTLILRADGGFEYANTAFCRAVGYSTRELAALPPQSIIAAESQAVVADIATRVRAGGVGRGTLTRMRKDGSTFVTSATVVPLVNARGELTHFVGLERDVSDEVKLRDQMIHAERLSAVGQLVSGVAHEINNPLQTIVGFTEIMLGSETRAESRRDLERIFTEANRAGKIVRNLLSFVRRSSHARTHDDLNDLVQSTVSLRAYELRVAGIELVESYDQALPGVFVNREEVQQVVLNLILNAEQAMLDAHGRGRLAITTGRLDSMLFVDVEDDGPGVPAALAGQIFEPFFTTKEIGKGTGLGLSIAIGIAAGHGGRLQLLPAASRGARFRLTLPPADAPRARGEPEGEAVVSLPAPGRVALVVDDEPAVRDLVSRLLTRRGYAVDAASDGEAALDLAEKSEYDLVLCDEKMPRMRGAEVFDRLGDVAPALRNRFVFITGDLVAGDIAELAAAHHIPLLAKPFTSADLDAVLAEIDALETRR